MTVATLQIESHLLAHLHVHTEYSLTDGAIRIKDLVNKAVKLGHKSIAITDHANMHGIIDFYSEAQYAGIKPIIGCEIYHDGTPETCSLIDDLNLRASDENHAFHLTLLAKNNDGYHSLMKIVSYGYLHGLKDVPIVPRSDLDQYTSGIIALSGCLKGEFARLVALLSDHSTSPFAELTNPTEECRPIVSALNQHVQSMIRRFGQEGYYIELTDNNLPQQKNLLPLFVEIAGFYNLQIVATCDAHYLNPEDERAHSVLTAIKNDLTRTKIANRRRDCRFHLLSNEEMLATYENWPQALLNTSKIASECEVTIEFGKYFLPEYKLDQCESIEEELKRLARDGLEERLQCLRPLYGKKLTPEKEKSYWERLDFELEVIISMGFPGYFLIVQDFINWAKKNDIPVGPGRGSGAGSLVAYSLKITDLDPFPLNLIFERFLNPERVSMPDFDVDFCQSRRDEVIKYVTEKYGANNVGQITTFGKMKAKAALRDVGRFLEISYPKVDRIAKLIPNEIDIKLKVALEREPRLREEAKKDELIAEMLNLALQIENLNRHTSVHAAGVVISNGGMENYVPVYKTEENQLITQYEMKNVEKVGLVKFDFLGLKTLTVVKKATDFIRRNENKNFNIETIDLEDKKVYQEISSGNTVGIFQLESSGMRALVTKLKPSCFEDIIAVVALFRPGPLGSGMVDDFIDRKHGKQKITYPIPMLEPILRETYGIILYQEQVQKIAATLANYSLGEADLLRRAMGKKKPEEMAKQQARFVEGCKNNHIDPKIAEELFGLMEKFAEYGFNKSHSAAYGLVSYQTAYVKTHYPEYFMAAIMTCDLDNTDKIVRYVEDCKRMSFEVLPPDINRSFFEFDVPAPKKIGFGLMAIKGLGAATLEPIISDRQFNGPFSSLTNLAKRINLQKIGKKTLELLTEVGALDHFRLPRRVIMSAIGDLIKFSDNLHNATSSGQRFLFEIEEAVSEFDINPYFKKEKNKYLHLLEIDWLLKEKKLLGSFVSGHPLDYYGEDCKKFGDITISQLPSYIGHKKALVLFLSTVTERFGKNGRKIFNLKLEDLTGSYDAVMFPNDRLPEPPLAGSVVHVTTSLKKSFDGSSISMVIDDITLLSTVRKAAIKYLTINISGLNPKSSSEEEKNTLNELKRILSEHQGVTAYTIRIKYEKTTVDVIPGGPGIDSCDNFFQSMKSLRNRGVEIFY